MSENGSTIKVPRRVWSALQAIAERQAAARGGKPDLGNVVAQLVEAESARQAQRERRDA